MGVASVGPQLQRGQFSSPQHHQQITALADGRFVVTWRDVDVHGALFDATGAGEGPLLGFTAAGARPYFPQTAALPNGGFVIAWDARSGWGADTDTAHARQFAMDGTAVGQQIRLYPTGNAGQHEPQVTALADGGFVITWTDFNPTGGDADGQAVRAQVFGAGGAPEGTEILVNTTTRYDQIAPQIAALTDGGFVIAWRDESRSGGDTDGSAVRAQVFASGGAPVGGEILVNATTQGDQFDPQITALSDGGFVIAWQDRSQSGGDTDGQAVRAQVFAAGGAPVGTEILVNTTTTGDQHDAQLAALSNGGFVVAWQDRSDIRAQVFASDGHRPGTEILVNTTTAGDQLDPRIVALAGGGFVIAWDDQNPSSISSDGALWAQAFNASGVPLGAEVLVNFQAAGDPGDPRIAALAGGGFAIAWQDGLDMWTQAFVLNNEAPMGADAILAATTGASRTLRQADFGFSDLDGHALAAVRIVSLPGSGALKLGGAPLTAGQWVNAADIDAGLLAFTPAAAGTASFTFQVQDDGGTADAGVDLDATPNSLTFDAAEAPPPQEAPTLGGGGSDVAFLSAGDDVYSGLGGDDMIHGGDGADILHGNAGNDEVYGGTGDDLLYGGKGDDALDGGQGNDVLYGDLGDDRLSGSWGDDVMQGGAGNDRLDGGEGADTVRGGQGDDLVQGGAGNDWLSGDLGNDTLTGGSGADTFHIFAGAGIDLVTDFNLAEGDRVQLLPGATWSASQVGADTVVDLADAQMVLRGVQLSTLGEGWVFGA